MKKTNRCELCGRVYRYPLTISEFETRFRICLGCDTATQKMIKSPDKWIEKYKQIKEGALND